jgi:hypothetical protein
LILVSSKWFKDDAWTVYFVNVIDL